MEVGAELKILHLDIETSPILSYTWDIWNQNIGLNQIFRDWYIITWAASWEGEKKVIGRMLPDFDLYNQDPHNDKELMASLWPLMDEADILVAHNGDKFDMPKINARFLYHGMLPPSPSKTIDTLKSAKKYFKFTSNRIDYINKFLGFGGKVDTGGMQLWLDCLNGDMKAWRRMLKYNKRDVVTLKETYNKLRPYIKNHPNIHSPLGGCPACGELNLVRKGYTYTPTNKYQKFVCKSCGKWSREAIAETKREYSQTQMRNIP
jgi:hypothetical protein